MQKTGHAVGPFTVGTLLVVAVTLFPTASGDYYACQGESFCPDAPDDNLACALESFVESTSGTDPALLENNGVDNVLIRFDGSHLAGEAAVKAARIWAHNQSAAEVAYAYREVTAGDLTTTTEPPTTDDDIVTWNAAVNDRVNFKFRHTFPRSDEGGSWELRGRVYSSTGYATCTTESFTLHNWTSVEVNEGVTGRVYDASGTAQAADWGGWSGAPAATVTPTHYVRVNNSGTQAGTITLTVPATLAGETDPSATIPVTTSALTLYTGTGDTPADVGTWTPLSWVTNSASIETPPLDAAVWVRYDLTLPQGTKAQDYSGSLTLEW